MTQANTLAALDFYDIACQCPVHRCTEHARYVVHLHAIHACNSAGLDPFGNRIQIRCESCTRRLQLEVAQKLRALRPWGHRPCEGCGAPIAAVGDVVRELVELP